MVRIKRLIHPEVQPLDWKVAIPAIGLVIAGIAFCANTALADSAPVSIASAQTSEPSFVDLNSCKPMYPQESLDHLEEGIVKVSFRVDANGRLLRTRLLQSSGHPSLDNATITGLKACAFKAGMRNGKPVASSFTADYVWKID